MNSFRCVSLCEGGCKEWEEVRRRAGAVGAWAPCSILWGLNCAFGGMHPAVLADPRLHGSRAAPPTPGRRPLQCLNLSGQGGLGWECQSYCGSSCTEGQQCKFFPYDDNSGEGYWDCAASCDPPCAAGVEECAGGGRRWAAAGCSSLLAHAHPSGCNALAQPTLPARPLQTLTAAAPPPAARCAALPARRTSNAPWPLAAAPPASRAALPPAPPARSVPRAATAPGPAPRAASPSAATPSPASWRAASGRAPASAAPPARPTRRAARMRPRGATSACPAASRRA